MKDDPHFKNLFETAEFEIKICNALDPVVEEYRQRKLNGDNSRVIEEAMMVGQSLIKKRSMAEKVLGIRDLLDVVQGVAARDRG